MKTDRDVRPKLLTGKYCFWRNEKLVKTSHIHCVTRARIRSYSGPYFSAFGLNTERYFVSICIQSECGKNNNKKIRIQAHIRECLAVAVSLFQFIIALLHYCIHYFTEMFQFIIAEGFLGKGVLKICSKFTGEHPWPNAISDFGMGGLL